MTEKGDPSKWLSHKESNSGKATKSRIEIDGGKKGKTRDNLCEISEDAIQNGNWHNSRKGEEMGQEIEAYMQGPTTTETYSTRVESQPIRNQDEQAHTHRYPYSGQGEMDKSCSVLNDMSLVDNQIQVFEDRSIAE
ncbi:hypothetical protein Q3G72_008875 [Acer saccharum]|nr:hypothetical protein Q3G72_008875 [Acer saccharum]